MTESDRPLPEPTRQRFGRDTLGESGPLLSDRMALAAAEGRLDEFMQQEIPGSDHAHKLALMMMGMSGMMPVSAPSPTPATVQTQPGEAAPAPAEVPPAVLAAAMQGDVESLKGLLQAEHARRAGIGGAAGAPPESAAPAHAFAGPATAKQPAAGIDSRIVDELIRISADNDVSVDWLMLRAVKLYVAEYRTTGRL